MSKIVTAFVFFFAALALGFFYTLPAWQKFQSLGGDIGQLEQASAEFDRLIANRDNLLNLINGITKDNLDRLNQMFPQGAHASDFLVAIEALTSQNAIALRRIDLVSPSSGGQGSGKSAASVSQPRPTATAGMAGGAGASAGSAAGAKKQDKANAAQELPFSIQVAGSYDNFKRFLASTERDLRLIDVDEVSFSTSGKRDEPIEFTLKAKTYYQ